MSPATAPAPPPRRLTPTQQGMLYHQLAHPGAGMDLEQIVCTLPEPIDPALLERAWAEVIRRHPALRSSIAWDDPSGPRQVVHPAVAVPLAVHGRRGRCGAAWRDEFESWLRDDRARGFALDRPPLHRLALFCLSDAEHVLVWSFPHLLLDGRSFPLVLREVFLLYDAWGRGESAALPTVPPPPAAQPPAPGPEAEAFWRRLLQGVEAATPLPAARTAPGPDRLGEHELRLTSEATAHLREFAAARDLTLATLVHAAWATVVGRHADADDVVFGTVRACRPRADTSVPHVGCLINTLPMRVTLPPEAAVGDWLAEVRAQERELRAFETTPLVEVRRWSGVPPERPLFETLVVYDHASLETTLRAEGARWARRGFRLHERTGHPLTLYAYGEERLLLRLAYEASRIDEDRARRLLGHVATVLTALPRSAARPLSEVPLLTEAEREALVRADEATAVPVDRVARVHDLIARQAARTPGATALIAGDERVSYGELDQRAERLAARLRARGAAPGMRIALCTDRSVDLVVGLLGILKSGSAYVPLDPSHPAERLHMLLADAGARLLVTRRHLAARLPADGPPRHYLDDTTDGGAAVVAPVLPTPTPDDLAYVIYTSGSTGRPKGVMVRHRNVANLLAAMDRVLGAGEDPDDPGTWLAVTSVAFDIAVVELLWTLTRGFTVVLRPDEGGAPGYRLRRADRPSFSLFYFASDERRHGGPKYRLLLDGARFADRHGFEAVWIPERHFHAFGGLYPNPSVLAAAVAAATERIALRAGSVVLPLHHPARVAEEWAVVDQLSGGRVAISFASGWHPDDFVLRPENFRDARAVMRRDLDVVRRLWRGEPVSFPGARDGPVEVRTLPRPVQPELPFWLTAAGSPETFRAAGALGAGVLTHLLGQTIDDLETKLAIYRTAWREHGHGPGDGHVTLMLHTFVGDDEARVRATVRGPMIEYLRSSLALVAPVAASFPPFRGRLGEAGATERDVAALPAEDREALLDYAFERYYATSGLFGTVESCAATVERLRRIGVDEIACLIDYGVGEDEVLAGLERLRQLRDVCAGDGSGASRDETIGALIRRHGVTHLQCTPSLLGMLLEDAETREALGALRMLLVGGEPFPPALAARVRQAVRGTVLNMYGPTETTVWSTAHRLDEDATTVPIGRPIANTQCYVVDRHLRLLPAGAEGELLIGGDGVAAGYLDRPELTAERFVPDPFHPEPGRRAYRTGDRVRRRADGLLEFLGRMDDQVKLRGVRIEPGEVRAVLARHPGVRDAVVVVRAGADGDRRLVAYVVPATESAPPSESELRRFLRERLPEVMVPSDFVGLDAMPLTPNLKIDRRALPAPAVAAATADEFVRPRDALEQRLVAIWERVLGRAPIGLRDGFFELGGHSLLAVTLVAEIQRVFGRRLPPTALLAAPTIEQLAEVLRREGCAASWSSLVALQATGRRPPLYLVHYNGGHVLHYHTFAHLLGPDQPVYGLQAPGLDGSRPLLESVEAMAECYVDEIRAFQPRGPYFVGGNCFGGLIAFEIARCLEREGERAGLVALLHSAAPRRMRVSEIVRARLRETVVKPLDRARQRISHHQRRIAQLPPGARLAYVQERTGVLIRRSRHHAGTSGTAAPRALAEVKRVLQRAESRYRPGPFGGRLTVFRAIELSSTSPTPDLGWSAFALGGVDVIEVPGTSERDMIVEGPVAQALAERLRERIDASLAAAAGAAD